MTENLSERVAYVTTKAAFDVLNERSRQVTQKGYGQAHDDFHTKGEIIWDDWGAMARIGGQASEQRHLGNLPEYRKLLVEGAALILAEIERIDRAAAGEASHD